MKKTIIHIFCLCIMTVTSSCCSQKLDNPGEDVLITLGAAIENVGIETRTVSNAEPFRGTIATKDNLLTAKVLFSTEKGCYLHNPALPSNLPCYSMVTFDDSSYEYPEKYNGGNLKYPIDNSTVYCVGMYPGDDKWDISADGKFAERDIDGNEDIMYAGCMEGTWSAHFEPHIYKHQLSWLKLCVYATDSDTYSFWGDIQNISVESKAGIIISLSDDMVSFTSDSKDICAYEGSYQLSTTIHQIGSVFCSPEKEYKIKVKTKNFGETALNVTLRNNDGDLLASGKEAAGSLYVIELAFTPFAIIEGNCVLKTWEYQDENLYLN